MAEYYGTIQGNRGVASRIGSKNSGINAMVKYMVNIDINKIINNILDDEELSMEKNI
jgi:hypothetical protein